MATSRFYLDTNLLYSFLSLKKTHLKRVESAREFILGQKSKGSVLICSPIARIELYKHLFSEFTGFSRQKNYNDISGKFGELTSAGVLIEKAFNMDNISEINSMFDYAKKSYAEHGLGLADSFISAEAIASKSVLVTFDPDFKKGLKKLNWYNPETKQASDPAVKRLV